MLTVFKTDHFVDWVRQLRDARARRQILIAVDRMEQGNFGDVRPVGSGVSETRLHFGPGYRLYFFEFGGRVFYLVGGGDKSSQTDDIRRAIAMKARILEDLS